MTAPDKLALASRAEQAGGPGPDRELDRLIVRAAGYRQERMNGRWRWRSASGELLGHTWEPPRLTASLDAITALIAEKLPGWRVAHLGESREANDRGLYTGGWDARLHLTTPGHLRNLAYGEGKTPALALCAAFLKASASTEDQP